MFCWPSESWKRSAVARRERELLRRAVGKRLLLDDDRALARVRDRARDLVAEVDRERVARPGGAALAGVARHARDVVRERRARAGELADGDRLAGGDLLEARVAAVADVVGMGLAVDLEVELAGVVRRVENLDDADLRLALVDVGALDVPEEAEGDVHLGAVERDARARAGDGRAREAVERPPGGRRVLGHGVGARLQLRVGLRAAGGERERRRVEATGRRVAELRAVARRRLLRDLDRRARVESSRARSP